MFENPSKTEIDALLLRSRSVAVLGLSASPGRPSHHVASALQKFGYRIVPVNPGATEILGERAWPDLESAIQAAGSIDVVDVFRRSQRVATIVEDAIRLKVPALWLQEGVIDAVAAEKARAAGIFTVMNRCMFRERATLGA
jgi:predicted CoA-binding protein